MPGKRKREDDPDDDDPTSIITFYAPGGRVYERIFQGELCTERSCEEEARLELKLASDASYRKQS